MQSLLTILNNITAYSAKHSFSNLCWHALRKIAASNDAANWSAIKRDQFMLHSRLFITCGEAVFMVKDALEGARLNDLDDKLITELVEPLDRLEEFVAAIELDELNAAIDEYVEILLNEERHVVSREAIEFAANHFKSFFGTVYALNITERI